MGVPDASHGNAREGGSWEAGKHLGEGAGGGRWWLAVAGLGLGMANDGFRHGGDRFKDGGDGCAGSRGIPPGAPSLGGDTEDKQRAAVSGPAAPAGGSGEFASRSN